MGDMTGGEIPTREPAYTLSTCPPSETTVSLSSSDTVSTVALRETLEGGEWDDCGSGRPDVGLELLVRTSSVEDNAGIGPVVGGDDRAGVASILLVISAAFDCKIVSRVSVLLLARVEETSMPRETKASVRSESELEEESALDRMSEVDDTEGS